MTFRFDDKPQRSRHRLRYASLHAHPNCARLAASLVLLIAPMSFTPAPRAEVALDADFTTALTITGEKQAANLQLIVLEAPGCTYCKIFRRYVLSAYEASPKSRTIPLKYLDLNDEAYDQLGLDRPVDTVPTTILMQNNREVGRIPGYVGPENFFHAVNHLMGRVE